MVIAFFVVTFFPVAVAVFFAGTAFFAGVALFVVAVFFAVAFFAGVAFLAAAGFFTAAFSPLAAISPGAPVAAFAGFLPPLGPCSPTAESRRTTTRPAPLACALTGDLDTRPA
nr:hypothetical protein [Streptomyces regalis]